MRRVSVGKPFTQTISLINRAAAVLLVLLLVGCGSVEPATPTTTMATSAPVATTTPVPATATAVLPTRTNVPALAVISVDTIDQVERLYVSAATATK